VTGTGAGGITGSSSTGSGISGSGISGSGISGSGISGSTSTGVATGTAATGKAATGATHVPEHAWSRPSRLAWWVEAALLFIAYQAYEQLRGHIHPHAGPSVRHARWVIDLERWTWTLREQRLNHYVYAHKTLAQAMNIYYGTVHFVVPPLVLVWLWRRHPGQYARWRNILAALSLLGLLGFATFPLAPPRLTPSAYVHLADTTPYGGLGPLDRDNFTDTNPYAAMPSLHIGWSTWCACAVIGATTARRRRRWRWAALLYPALTLTVVVGTANHWLLDGVGGWVALALAWWAVTAWQRRTAYRSAARRGTNEPGALLRGDASP